MTRITTVAAAAGTAIVAALAGCGGDPERPAAQTTATATATATVKPARDLAAACAKAARDLEDPLAYAEGLPDPPGATPRQDRGAARLADRHRGTREILQLVYEAAGAPEDRRYRRAVNALIQELSDAELSVREDYDIEELPGRLATRWRRVEGAAPPACRAVGRPRYSLEAA